MMPSFLLDIDVVLEFACGSCSGTMEVKTKCTGKPLGMGVREAVKVKVPCPSCHCNNLVVFEPESGNILSVDVEKMRYLIPVPSLN